MQIEVFHGSDLVVTNPELRISSRALDFGPGFYTTTNREQAISFAKKVCERNQTTSAVVSVFKIDLDKLKQSLKGKWFESPDEVWLDFVSDNRSGKLQDSDLDCVYGPVANDTIFKTFIVYQNGILTKQDTIDRLKVRPLYNQLVFKTEAALKFLEFDRSFSVKV